MRYIALIMLLSASAAQADEAYLPLPDDVSIMDVGRITPADLGNVTASDLAVTPALPLPADQPLPGGLDDGSL